MQKIKSYVFNELGVEGAGKRKNRCHMLVEKVTGEEKEHRSHAGAWERETLQPDQARSVLPS